MANYTHYSYIHITGTSNPPHKADAMGINATSDSQGESQVANPPEISGPKTYKTF